MSDFCSKENTFGGAFKPSELPASNYCSEKMSSTLIYEPYLLENIGWQYARVASLSTEALGLLYLRGVCVPVEPRSFGMFEV